MIDLNGRLRLHSAVKHHVVAIGAERSPILIIDNFLSDPEVLIEYAATEARFDSVSDAFYPGVRAPIPPIYSFAVRAFLGDIIGKTFGQPASEIAKELSSFSLITTAPQNLQVLQRLPHFDNTEERQLALLHYLCPAHHGGTSFYRHRVSGFESIRPHRLDSYLQSLNAEISAHGVPPARYINGDTAQFERIASFEAQYNRMLVYRSISLHSADISPAFAGDENPRTGRLTANTFFFFR